MPPRHPDTQQVIHKVGERAFVNAAYMEIPADVRLSILRDKASKHDAAWMDIFASDGAFGGLHYPVDPENWKFHPKASPAIEALMSAMGKSATKSVEFVDPEDPRSKSVYAFNQMEMDPQFLAVFKRIVNDRLRLMETPLWNSEKGEEEIANCTLLLNMAIAGGALEIARSLIEVCPQSVHTLVRQDLLKKEMVGNSWVKPAAFALELNRPEMLELLFEHGHDPSSPVKYMRVQDARQNENPVDVPHDAADPSKAVPYTLGTLFLARFTAKPVSPYLPETIKMVVDLANAAGDEPRDIRLRSSLTDAGIKHITAHQKGGSEIVEIFDTGKLFDAPDAVRRIAIHAAKIGDARLLKRFDSRLDWTSFGNEEFLPVLVNTQDWSDGTPEKTRPLTDMLVDSCIAAGRGDMLANPNLDIHKPPVHPLHIFSAAGHRSAVYLAMEHGADPIGQDELGHTPLWWAKQYQHHDTEALLRSYVARKEALAALQDIDQPRP